MLAWLLVSRFLLEGAGGWCSQPQQIPGCGWREASEPSDGTKSKSSTLHHAGTSHSLVECMALEAFFQPMRSALREMTTILGARLIEGLLISDGLPEL